MGNKIIELIIIITTQQSAISNQQQLQFERVIPGN